MMDGFLGTPASFMLDVVVCSLALVVPTLLFSLYTVKIRKNYLLHKWIQIVLVVVLLIVVLLFEIDMRMQGGFWELAKDSVYVDTTLMKVVLYVHLVFSISTTFLLPTTAILAVKKMPNPPRPCGYSRTPKLLGWITVVDIVATAVTGLLVYYLGFMN